jgi:hypothetical protein
MGSSARRVTDLTSSHEVHQRRRCHRPNEAIAITLDPDDRTFTPEECARFEIDPCPTLEAIKTGSA